jgi:carboxylate-amine ligase
VHRLAFWRRFVAPADTGANEREGMYHLFQRFGVELEYVIVEERSLDVAPIADRILGVSGGDAEVHAGELTWCNELALHVIELKTSQPAERLDGLSDTFVQHVRRVNQRAADLGARLMPTGMHPWMDPRRETRLWPHDGGPIYQAFDRAFDCRGHGWSNLQSAHLNLPFQGDEEFGRLHAAVRLVLPLLPALAASSPLAEGVVTGFEDTRLREYRTNCARVPSVTGRVIPEAVFTRRDYHARILAPMYADVAPHDPEGVLHHEWLNARGAIARFERDTIEIRVLDVQETPHADLAIMMAAVAVLEALVGERWVGVREQQALAIDPLEAVFLDSLRRGVDARVETSEYLRCFGIRAAAGCTVGDLWRHLLSETAGERPARDAGCRAALDVMLREGSLSRRILAALGGTFEREKLRAVYGGLCACLAASVSFHA